MAGHDDSVEAVAFAPTLSTLVVSAGLDGKAIVWDTSTLDARATCVHSQVCSPTRFCHGVFEVGHRLYGGVCCSKLPVAMEWIFPRCQHAPWSTTVAGDFKSFS